MEKSAEKIFTELKEDISTYAGLKLRLLKLIAVEKAAGILSAFSHGIILLLLIFFTILFLFVALGLYLGELLNSMALGFLIVSGIYLLSTFCFLWAKRKIRITLMNTIIAAVVAEYDDDDDDDEDEKNKSTHTTWATDHREKGATGKMPGIGNQN